MKRIALLLALLSVNAHADIAYHNLIVTTVSTKTRITAMDCDVTVVFPQVFAGCNPGVITITPDGDTIFETGLDRVDAGWNYVVFVNGFEDLGQDHCWLISEDQTTVSIACL